MTYMAAKCSAIKYWNAYRIFCWSQQKGWSFSVGLVITLLCIRSIMNVELTDWFNELVWEISESRWNQTSAQTSFCEGIYCTDDQSGMAYTQWYDWPQRIWRKCKSIKDQVGSQMTFVYEEIGNQTIKETEMPKLWQRSSKKKSLSSICAAYIQKNNIIAGAEALVRWNSRRYGRSPRRVYSVIWKDRSVVDLGSVCLSSLPLAQKLSGRWIRSIVAVNVSRLAYSRRTL